MECIMRRFILSTAALIALAASAHAQPSTTYPYNLNLRGPGLIAPYGYGSSFTRPGPNLSPYLNLLRGGNPAANYYLGVVPEVERRNNAAQFAAGINDLRSQIEAPSQDVVQEILPTLQPTGHAIQFGNYGGFFGSSGFGTRPQGQQPPGAAPRRR
jgi:hypothetical protein